MVGDENENSRLAAALVTWLRVDVVETVDQLGPSFVGGASRRIRLGFDLGAKLVSVGSSHAIAVGAVEMNQNVSVVKRNSTGHGVGTRRRRSSNQFRTIAMGRSVSSSGLSLTITSRPSGATS